ncbi:MAG: ABC transporter substrate-binding protein [Thermoleophilaceae bacterium]
MRRAALLVALVCVALAGCGARSEPTVPKSTATMRVVVPPGAASTASIAAAGRQGLFREAGVAAQVETAASGIDALERGQAELAVTSEPALLQARDRGVRVVSVAALVSGSRVAVVSTGNVKTPRDLAGKRLGTFGTPYAQAFAKTLSARAGGSGIKVVAVSNPTKALQKHQVDAVLGPASQVHLKKARAVTVDKLGVPTYDQEVLVATEATTRERGDDIRSFIGALWHQAGGKAPGPQSPAQWRAFAEWMAANGLLKGQPNAAAAITSSVLPGSLRS